MPVREYSTNQSLMFPPCIKDFLPEKHLSRVIDCLIQGMDLSCFYRKVSKVGNPRYSPRMMLSILIYAYCNKIHSSRQIAKAVETDVAFIFLADMQRPNFRTINQFRKDNKEEFEHVFREVLKYCLHLGLVDLVHIAVDGSVIKANASTSRNYDSKRLGQLVEEIYQEAERIDEEEDEKYGKDKRGDELPEDIKDSKGLKEKIQKIRKKLEEEEKAEKARKERGKEMKRKKPLRVNSTDPDSKLQKDKSGYKQGYRLEVGVDSKSGIIVAAEVVNSQSDMDELVPILDQLEENIPEIKERGKGDSRPVEVTADSGYSSLENLKEVSKRSHYDCYIADSKATGKERRGECSAFDTSAFVYDEERDCYICPAGEVLEFKGNGKKRGKKIVKYGISGAICRGCPHFGKCTKSKRGRSISLYAEGQLLVEMREKVQSEKGKAIYRRRKGIVENVFGDIKRNSGFREFSLRGLEKVCAEGMLVALCYNIRKIFGQISKGGAEILEKLFQGGAVLQKGAS